MLVIGRLLTLVTLVEKEVVLTATYAKKIQTPLNANALIVKLNQTYVIRCAKIIQTLIKELVSFVKK
jgi:hypothetical protein